MAKQRVGLTVACPKCGVPAGTWCVGRNGTLADLHPIRKEIGKRRAADPPPRPSTNW